MLYYARIPQTPLRSHCPSMRLRKELRVLQTNRTIYNSIFAQVKRFIAPCAHR